VLDILCLKIKGDTVNNGNPRVSGASEKDQIGFGYRILRIVTDVYPGEALTVLLLTFNGFVLFLSYYIMKPVRDALVLVSFSAELKLYLSAAIAVSLIFVVKAFSLIASRFPRQKLITWVTLFFMSNLVIFWVLHLSGISPGTMGIIFYIWVGIFNLIIVAQFWGFANDLYTEDEGKRLFPLVQFGATFGGFAGGWVTKSLTASLESTQLMLVSAVFLGICILLTWIIHIRETKRAKLVPKSPPEKSDKVGQKNSIGEKKEKPLKEGSEKPGVEDQEKPLEKGGAFRLLFKSRYLILIAFFVLVMNFINTNGVYMLDTVAQTNAVNAVETGTAEGLDKEQYLTAFFASFYNIQNLFAMFVQLFLVSRIFKWFGVRAAIFILPVFALGGYFFISFGAILVLVKWIKAMENGMDYSLMNTVRGALFLITTREEKYKAQAVTKTFFHRAGDVLCAALIFIGTTFLAFRIENFAMVNVVLAIIWIVIGIYLAKEHKKLSAERDTLKRY
jgi:AAA family ATP:ADP antiporter